MTFRELRPLHWNRDRLHEILALGQKRKVLVVGDVGVDRYTIGSVERISPEAPVPIVFVQEEQLKLGLAANVADNLQALGSIPILLGIVGKDRAAQDFKKLLKKSHISSQHLVLDRTRRTVLKERVVSDRQQLVRIDYESIHPIHSTTEKQVLKKFRNLLPTVDGIIIEDYAKGLFSEKLTHSIFALAKKSGKWVAVDPNLKTPLRFYQGASILTPNTKEAEALTGISIRDLDSLRKAGAQILKRTSARYVVITRGKDGMAIFSRGTKQVKLIPTYAREVYDVSGAGDTVISVLILALISGATIEEACVLGNLAAGVEVGKRGTATVSPEEVGMAIDFFKTMGT